MNHSQFVRLAKRFLLVSILLIPTLVGLGLILTRIKDSETACEGAGQDPTFSQLRLIGETKQRDNFSLSASGFRSILQASPIQTGAISTRVNWGDIFSPTLSVQLNGRDGDWLFLRASDGTFDNRTKCLQLGSGVDLFTSFGYEGHTRLVTVDLEKGDVHSPTPFRGHGPLGFLSADGMGSCRREKRELIFWPNARGCIYPSARSNHRSGEEDPNLDPNAWQTPVRFSAKCLVISRKDETVTLKRDVLLVQGEQRLSCQEIAFQLRGSSLYKASIKGPVRAHLRGKWEVLADRAIYDPAQHKLFLFQNVRLTMNKRGEITGDRLAIDTRTGKAELSTGPDKKVQGKLTSQYR